ncbi:Hpt domain-containing protein [Crenothrix sp.]|uniref:Hpt domain-containing protein n=1 Tax=Crenothrix sp. TaxID=3100433 RepID=UPI00374DC764
MIKMLGMEPFNLLLIEKKTINSYSSSLLQDDVCLTIANNENEALITLLYTRFNLILLDAALANAEIIYFVKNAGNLNCKTPLVVMIAEHKSHSRIHFMSLGIDDCWNKSSSANALAQFIQKKKNTHSLAPIDYIQILLDKTQNNENLTIIIFKKLFFELPQQITDIKYALQNKQFQNALDITHKLHGSVSFCGFIDIQQPAFNLENSLSRKDYQAVTGCYRTLKAAILNFTTQEKAILDLLPGGG